MEVFKGVVRNQGTLTPGPAPGAKKSKSKAKRSEGPTLYRYVVMGMIVTDQPIPEFETKKGKGEFDDNSTFVLAGDTFGLLSAPLSTLPQVEPKRDIRGYSANQILTGLNDI